MGRIGTANAPKPRLVSEFNTGRDTGHNKVLSNKNFSTNAQNPGQTAIKFSLLDTPISSEDSFTFPVSHENDPRALCFTCKCEMPGSGTRKDL